MKGESKVQIWALALMRPIRRGARNYLLPVTDSKEFKGLYPFLVISLGVLAAFPIGQVRNLAIFSAFAVLALSALLFMAIEAKKIPLKYKWNILFVSYYRPFLLLLNHKIARPLDGSNRLDFLTYRPGDFLKALEEKAVDFSQVSGAGEIHLVSFDIEFIPLLKNGINVLDKEHKLIPLSDFWINEQMQEFPSRIPKEVRAEVLQRIDQEKLFALPIGWGLVGVAIVDEQLSIDPILSLVTDTRGHADNRMAFSFERFIEHIGRVREMGYDVICFDFWNGIGQLAALYCTGHTNLAKPEYEQIRLLYKSLFAVLTPTDFVSEPQLIIDRARSKKKAIIIGGSTWTGLKGTLLPIAIPDSGPTYGAFCECFGLLCSPRTSSHSMDWEHDACALVNWLLHNLSDRTEVGGNGLAPGGSIVDNYLPGMRIPKSDGHYSAKKRIGDLNPMKWDTESRILFRHFSGDSVESAKTLRDLWYSEKPV